MGTGDGMGTGTSGSGRRGALVAIGLAAASMIVPASATLAFASDLAGSAASATGREALASVELPPSLGESELQVFVEETGHTLGGVLLDYWRATGGAAVYGDPISEPFAAPNGYYSQAFENGIFQFRPERVTTVDPIVGLMPVGREMLDERAGGFRSDGRRAGGGGDRRAAAWRPLDRDGEAVERASEDSGAFVEATGRSIGGAFAEWYEAHEGEFYLGAPLGEPLEERGRTVQWFEGGLLVAGAQGVTLAPLGREMAPRLGVDTAPVDGGGLPAYDESLFQIAENPYGQAHLRTPGPKRIEVDLSQQRLWAYQGRTLVTTSLVTTGLAPNVTEQGRFRVRYKKPVEDMRGATDAEGNVIWVAGDLEPEPIEAVPYGVSDVPNVLYFNLEAEALHGAYWRDVFGETGSHGCVNLPVELAAFLYGWAPLGTPVWVHE